MISRARGTPGQSRSKSATSRRMDFGRGPAIERRAVGELIGRLVHRRIGVAPEPPGLLGAERLRGVGQMFVAVPGIECRTPGGIRNGGTDDEE